LFRGLDAAQKERVTICYRKRAGVAPNIKKIDDNIPESYVHAKMMIVDDKFAMIGSANSGTRSYTHDSEVVAGIFDGATPDSRALPFAHGLRVRLWTKHLLLPPHTLHDPVAALAHWRKPSPASAIGIYDPAGDIDVSIRNFAPDHLGEPYGGIPGKELAP
jgi:phosphatidylserine/phosphatidylglycerophosphate/cardiolipin synthase-like enzyme